MRAHVVEDGMVVNTIEVDTLDHPTLHLIDGTVGGIGWRIVGGTPVPPDASPRPAPVPTSVTNFQARAALIGAALFDQVDAAVRTSGDPIAVQAWDYANTITRHGTLVNAIGTGLGLTSEQLDDLFRQAATIEA
jgi:hypothetical protein